MKAFHFQLFQILCNVRNVSHTDWSKIELRKVPKINSFKWQLTILKSFRKSKIKVSLCEHTYSENF